jgi:hypothetical protein
MRKLLVMVACLMALAGAGMSDGGATLPPESGGVAYPGDGDRYCTASDRYFTQRGMEFAFLGVDFRCYGVTNETFLAWFTSGSHPYGAYGWHFTH